MIDINLKFSGDVPRTLGPAIRYFWMIHVIVAMVVAMETFKKSFFSQI